MKSVLTLGSATQDIFIYSKETESFKALKGKDERCFMLIEEGAKIEVNSLHYASGGGATNSAVSFKRLGFNVASFFQCGDDEAGRFIIDDLAKSDIDSSTATITKSHRTGTSFIFPSVTNNRAIFAYRGANAELQEQQIPFARFSQFDLIYITSLSGASSDLLPSITRHAKQQGLFVATNPGTSQLTSNPQAMLQALPYIDVFILNSKEAKTFFGHRPSGKKSSHTRNAQQLAATITQPFPLLDYFTAILSQGPSLVVVTDGAHGVYVADKEYIYFHPSLPVSIINTVGAGDAFGSSFVATIVNAQSIEEAIVRGIINSACVIGHQDAKQGLMPYALLEKQARLLGTESVIKIRR